MLKQNPFFSNFLHDDLEILLLTFRLLLITVFDLGSKSTCTDNYLQIIEVNKDTGKSDVARQFCGEDNPSPYKSQTSVLSIRFKKTLNFAGTGWIIGFMAVEDGSTLQSW